jgi:hypothetical protein
VRPRYLPLKRFAATLLRGIIPAAVLIGATTPPPTQEALNLVNPLSYGSAFTGATLAAAVRGVGANAQTLVAPPGIWQIQNDLAIPAHAHIRPGAVTFVAGNTGHTKDYHYEFTDHRFLALMLAAVPTTGQRSATDLLRTVRCRAPAYMV